MFDLHIHSIHSRDGEKKEEELLELAKYHHLQMIALCDHNTVKGVEHLLQLGKEQGIEIVPGIECDTLFEGYEVHVLGYDIDTKNSYFQKLEDEINKKMIASNKERMVLLNEVHGLEIDIEAMMELCKDHMNPFMLVVDTLLADPIKKNNPLFQPYLPGGKRSDTPNVNFYHDLCGVGTPCYVKVEYPSLEDTVARIQEAGGFAVIAHPFRNFYQQDVLLEKALMNGIVGLEVFSNYHTTEQREYYLQFAKNHQCLITCGSDYHGIFKPKIEMGDYGPKDVNYEEYYQAFQEYRKVRR